MKKHGYTIDDMVAMSVAFRCSYGVIQQFLEFGRPLPKQVRSVKWPKGSAHVGEYQLAGSSADEETEGATSNNIPANLNRPIATKYSCSACGGPLVRGQSTGAYLRRLSAKGGATKMPVRRLCPTCKKEFVPGIDRHGNARIYAPRSESGERIGDRNHAICFRCGVLHAKIGGAQIYATESGTSGMHVAGYLCGECAILWEQETKKGAAE